MQKLKKKKKTRGSPSSSRGIIHTPLCIVGSLNQQQAKHLKYYFEGLVWRKILLYLQIRQLAVDFSPSFLVFLLFRKNNFKHWPHVRNKNGFRLHIRHDPSTCISVPLIRNSSFSFRAWIKVSWCVNEIREIKVEWKKQINKEWLNGSWNDLSMLGNFKWECVGNWINNSLSSRALNGPELNEAPA